MKSISALILHSPSRAVIFISATRHSYFSRFRAGRAASPPAPLTNRSRTFRCASAEVAPLPSLLVPVPADASPAVHHFLELLEDHDDVRWVWSNAEFQE